MAAVINKMISLTLIFLELDLVENNLNKRRKRSLENQQSSNFIEVVIRARNRELPLDSGNGIGQILFKIFLES